MRKKKAVNKIITSTEHCHDCGNTMKIELDASKDGNHVIECPHCGHEHCRVIEFGRVTRWRWDSRNNWNGPIYYATAVTASAGTMTMSYYGSNATTTAHCGSLWLSSSSVA